MISGPVFLKKLFLHISNRFIISFKMAFIGNLFLYFGPLLLTGGILNYFLTPFFVKFISQRLLVIEPGTLFYDKWIKIPIPLSVDLYVFDVQNPKEIMSGRTAIVKEIGPFSFSQTREKKIIKYSADRETVTYMERKLFFFEKKKSIGDLNRHFIIPNVALLSTINVWNGYLKKFPLSMIVQPLAESFLMTVMEYYQQNLFINVTIDQMMFKGVHLNYVPLLRSLSDLFGRFGIGNEIGALSNDSFYFFKYINNTMAGPYEVHTGKESISKLTQLKKYHEKAILDIWDNVDCNTVKGSDGIQFEPLKKDKSQIHVFTHELCRTVTLEYKRDSEVRGIRTMRYEPSSNLFSKKNPENSKCDCTESYHCKYSGVVDLSPCWYKAPLYGSVPHFAGEEFAEIRKTIVGLQPNESKHKSFVELDPITGSTLRGTKRGQINAYIERMASMRSTRAVKDALFIPLFWYEEYGEIDDKLEDEIKRRSVYPLMVTNYLMMFSLIVGSFFTLLSCVVVICCRKRKKKVHHKVKTAGETKKLYLDNNYQKLSNLDDAENSSTKTESSTASSEQMKTISTISNNSIDSMQRAEFILVQPIQQQTKAQLHDNHAHGLHSLALVPAYQRLPIFSNDYHQQTHNLKGNNTSTFKSQIESNNYLPPVDYQIPSAQVIDESIRAFSRLIELNNQTLTNRNDGSTNNLQLIPANVLSPTIAQVAQFHNSHSDQLTNHRQPKLLTKQLSSKSNSFD